MAVNVRVAVLHPVSPRPHVLSRLVHRRAAAIALVVLAVLVLGAVLAPLLAPYSPTQIGAGPPFAAPSLQHLFGTDELGRDLFSRTLYGARLTFLLAVAATAVTMVVGIVWGFAAAYAGGWRDEVLMRPADVVMAVPPILFALILVAAFGATTVSLSIIIGLLLAPATARLARSAVLAELHTDYRLALRAIGTSELRTLFRELLPNTMPSLIAQTSLNMAAAILIEASLSFLGLGVQPPEASWGSLVQQGYQYIYDSPWYVIFPGALIFIAIWTLSLLGDELQAVLDPKRTS
jgi:peptide/nickel transport system permease protein